MKCTSAVLVRFFVCAVFFVTQCLPLSAQMIRQTAIVTDSVAQTNQADTALQQGRRLLRRGQADQALGYLETALTLYATAKNNRGAAAAHNELGDLYLRQGQYKVALDHYQKGYQAFTGLSSQEQTSGAAATSAASRVGGANAGDRKSTRLNSSHIQKSRMPSSA